MSADRAVIYLRQSRDSLQNGLAVERQREDCVKVAADRGWQVTGTFTDNDLSASNGKARPAYEQMLQLVDAGAVDVIVAYHVDRLTRRLADLEHLIARCEQARVRVATVSGDIDLSTDAGRLVGRILGSVAAGEVERKSARQKRAGRQAAESGRPPARRAFGFTNGAHDPVEAPALAELYRQVLAGMGLLAATRWLNERGHVTVTGRPWERSSVKAMLRNPRNAGFRSYNGEVVRKGDWEPIVDEATWRAVVELLDQPARSFNPSNATRWLGGGIYECCHCGSKVRVNYSANGNRIYQCQKSAHLGRAAHWIDRTVEVAVVERLRRPDLLELLTADTSDEIPVLRDRANADRLRLEQVTSDYADGLLTGQQLRVATDKITDRLTKTEQQLAQAGRSTRLGPLLAAKDPGQAWLDSDLAVKRTVLDSLCTVTLLAPKRGNGPFDPATVRIDWTVPA